MSTIFLNWPAPASSPETRTHELPATERERPIARAPPDRRPRPLCVPCDERRFSSVARPAEQEKISYAVSLPGPSVRLLLRRGMLATLLLFQRRRALGVGRREPGRASGIRGKAGERRVVHRSRSRSSRITQRLRPRQARELLRDARFAFG